MYQQKAKLEPEAERHLEMKPPGDRSLWSMFPSGFPFWVHCFFGPPPPCPLFWSLPLLWLKIGHRFLRVPAVFEGTPFKPQPRIFKDKPKGSHPASLRGQKSGDWGLGLDAFRASGGGTKTKNEPFDSRAEFRFGRWALFTCQLCAQTGWRLLLPTFCGLVLGLSHLLY